jgi:hypothetical protein
MTTLTRSLIIGISVVLITSAVLGARAPDSEAEQAITTFYHRYLTTCGDSWYAAITFAISGKGTPRFIATSSPSPTPRQPHVSTPQDLLPCPPASPRRAAASILPPLPYRRPLPAAPALASRLPQPPRDGVPLGASGR